MSSSHSLPSTTKASACLKDNSPIHEKPVPKKLAGVVIDVISITLLSI